MIKVVTTRATYDYEKLRPRVFQIMDAAGGDRIVRTSRVVIKPNLLAPATPDKAMLTHPLIVRSVVEYVLERGARPQISDSPAMGSFQRILKDSGIKDALEGLDVVYKEFKTSTIIDVGEPFHRIEIAEDAMRADFLINLPKLKTHAQMLLTLGVKNLFGCIVGLKKPEWHLRAGVDRERFALLLLRIYEALRPPITILDGILAMEGEGPGKSGKPRFVGVLMGSTDALAVDVAVCKMLGIHPERLWTVKMARKASLWDEEIIIDGDFPPVEGFEYPEATSLVFGPKLIHGFLRNHLIRRPEPVDSMCKLCGECWRYCPAGAISCDRTEIQFDYDKCIRCYCCLEVCPHGALRSREPLPGKILRKLQELKEDAHVRCGGA